MLDLVEGTMSEMQKLGHDREPDGASMTREVYVLLYCLGFGGAFVARNTFYTSFEACLMMTSTNTPWGRQLETERKLHCNSVPCLL